MCKKWLAFCFSTSPASSFHFFCWCTYFCTAECFVWVKSLQLFRVNKHLQEFLGIFRNYITRWQSSTGFNVTLEWVFYPADKLNIRIGFTSDYFIFSFVSYNMILISLLLTGGSQRKCKVCAEKPVEARCSCCKMLLCFRFVGKHDYELLACTKPSVAVDVCFVSGWRLAMPKHCELHVRSVQSLLIVFFRDSSIFSARAIITK